MDEMMRHANECTVHEGKVGLIGRKQNIRIISWFLLDFMLLLRSTVLENVIFWHSKSFTYVQYIKSLPPKYHVKKCKTHHECRKISLFLVDMHYIRKHILFGPKWYNQFWKFILHFSFEKNVYKNLTSKMTKFSLIRFDG